MRQNQAAPAENVPLAVIGVVRSAYAEPETTPIQAALNRAGRGTIEIAGPYREGLAGLDGFGYAWLLDGTPVIDLKPYVTRFDRPPGDPACGWFDDLTISDGSTPAGLGPAVP